MQNDAVAAVEDGQAPSHLSRLLEQREICEHMVDASAGRADERCLAAAAAEHLAQTGLRVGVVLLRLQPDDLISLGLGHGVAVRDHEVRVQAERARVAQTAVGAGNERVRMLSEERADVTVICFGRGCKDQRVPPFVSSHSFRSFTLS